MFALPLDLARLFAPGNLDIPGLNFLGLNLNVPADDIEDPVWQAYHQARNRRLAQARKEILERIYWYLALSILGTVLLLDITSVSYVDVLIANQFSCIYNFIKIRKEKPCRIYTFLQLFLFIFAYMAKPFAYLPCLSVCYLIYASFEMHHVHDIPLPYSTFIIPTVMYAFNYFDAHTFYISRILTYYGISHNVLPHLRVHPSDVIALGPFCINLYLAHEPKSNYAAILIFISYATTFWYMDLSDQDEAE